MSEVKYEGGADMFRRLVAASQVLVTDGHLYLKWLLERKTSRPHKTYIYIGCEGGPIRGWVLLKDYLRGLNERWEIFQKPPVSLEEGLSCAFGCLDRSEDTKIYLIPPEALTVVSDQLRLQVSRFAQAQVENLHHMRMVQFIREGAFLDFGLNYVFQVDDREASREDLEAYFNETLTNIPFLEGSGDRSALLQCLQGMNRPHIHQALTYSIIRSKKTGQVRVTPELLEAYRLSVGLGPVT